MDRRRHLLRFRPRRLPELYRFDLKSNQTKKITSSGEWDVRWPSSDGKGRIVYELNGELQVLDAKSGKSTALDITVPDDGIYPRPAASASGLIEDAELSPKGERVLFVARGDVFSAPTDKGYTRNLTQTSNAHERLATWSPDGRSVAYVSDQSGEEQIWIVDHEGEAPPQQLTDGPRGRLDVIEWAPDSKASPSPTTKAASGSSPSPTKPSAKSLTTPGIRSITTSGRPIAVAHLRPPDHRAHPLHLHLE
ncbi:MAG: hypothetical protein R2724_32125 [Bryobacterales bacterium]